MFGLTKALSDVVGGTIDLLEEVVTLGEGDLTKKKVQDAITGGLTIAGAAMLFDTTEDIVRKVLEE